MKKFNFKPQQKRFSFSFAASLAVHILLVLLITTAEHDKPLPKKDLPQIMDVTLLDDKKKPAKKAPKEARTMANQNAVGSSKHAQDKITRQAKAPMAGQQRTPKPAPPKQPKTPPPTPTKPQRTRMLAKRGPTPDTHKTSKKRKPVKHKPVKHKKTVKPRKQVPLANLMPSAMALSQLSRDFARERRMKQKLNREADIPINTRQVKYAPYAHALVRALEEQWRPGQARYDEFPASARQSLVKLTIEHDGSLGGVEILRPSPIAQINESAIEAIHMAAPFKVLPSSWGLDRVSFYLTFEVIEDRFVFRPM
ncbi:MAG: TonB C-terminal domain-containing protein [Mariprofundus sp.]|nr:TonB C-terminal domain-containing protein [Mariprofundus sp.]